MNIKHLYVAGCMLMIGLAACNNNGSTGTTNPGDSTVTTTTTTTVVHHKYTGRFVPQPATKYIDLKTSKEITVRIDTVQGSIVNDETNEPVDLLVEPVTHDTIYGLTGTVVNNFVIHDPNGDVRVDTLRINTEELSNTTEASDDASHSRKAKYKENASGSKTKYKDEDEKIKEKNGVTKTKER